ncbi:ATP-dependent DNA helicase Q4 isoform X2 [Bacillus rossius redtenbacheri]
MEISFSEDCENSSSFSNSAFSALETNKKNDILEDSQNDTIDTTDSMNLHQLEASLEICSPITPIDINSFSGSSDAVPEGMLPAACEKNEEESKIANELKNVKGVWGIHLNVKKECKPENKKLPIIETRSSQLSQKLFAGAKFKIRNPRKPLSVSRTLKRNRSDSCAIESISNFDSVSCEDDYVSSSAPSQFQDVSLNLTCSQPSGSESNNACQSDKFKIATIRTPVAHTAVNIVQKMFAPSSSQSDCTPLRKIDQGWLERCAKANDLHCKPSLQNDSGIESLGSNAKSSISPEAECLNFKPCTMFDSVFDNAVVADSFQNKKFGESFASDEDIVDDSGSETESQSRFSFGIKRKSCSYTTHTNTPLVTNRKPDKKCKFDVDADNLISRKSCDKTSASPSCLSEGTPKECSKTVKEIDVYEIANTIVEEEKQISKKTKKKGGKLSKKELLEKKMSSGQANDNYVSINLKKKIYARGKKTVNFSKYKKLEWKKKKRAAGFAGCSDDTPANSGGGGLLTCFSCGDVGHYARNCLNKGDKLLPQDEGEEEDESPFPTLEQAEAMAAELAQPNVRRTFQLGREELEVRSLAEQKDLPDSMKEELGIETLPPSKVPPVYKLNEDGSLIDTPLEVVAALLKFGHRRFRPGQEEAVMRVLSGLSTLVTLSTGAGKSLCYQLPAYVYAQRSRCVTLVVSPLVSLMEDQVTGVPACLRVACLHTAQTPKQRQAVAEAAGAGRLDVLLVSPEAVVSGDRATGFSALLRQLPPVAFACVDEAHCVSQWSHNFRPSYLMVCQVLREKLGVSTILGLTATATAATRAGIAPHLGVPDGERGVISDVPLPANLLLSVSRDPERDRALVGLLGGRRFAPCGSIVVYCTRREECERLAALIRTCLQDAHGRKAKKSRLSEVAEPYHAGLSAARRKQVQKLFMSGELRIVVATVAFGMGINKPDIRGVIHYNMPHSFESYVQEVGRAGRDGLPAQCHLFLDSKGRDKNELRRHIHADSVDRHTVRRLLQRVFVGCKCATAGAPCPGHEVAFPLDDTVLALDLPRENVLTLLCYLQLDPRRWASVLPPAYTLCKVVSYKGPSALRRAAGTCAPLAMAIALDQRRGVSHEKSNIIEFPVVEVAAAIGWDSGLAKARLKNLEWQKVGDKWRRTGLAVEFSRLGFRVAARGDLPARELDEVLDTLHARVRGREAAALAQLESVFAALTAVSCPEYKECSEECNIDRSEQLKGIIREYFQREQVACDLPSEEGLRNEDQVAADVRALVCGYRDTGFTGRAVARIFHGIASPCFPAQVWGRCRFWRAHLDKGFQALCRVATREILHLK